MKLRTKLLLWVGVILTCIALMMFLVPEFFLRKDILDAANTVQKLLRVGYEEVERNQTAWLNQQLTDHETALNSTLFSLFSINATIPLRNLPMPLKNQFMQTIMSLILFNPHLGFLQLHQTETNQQVAILFRDAKLYSVHNAMKGASIFWLIDPTHTKPTLYVGIPLKEKSAAGDTYSALLRWESLTDEIKKKIHIPEDFKMPPTPSFQEGAPRTWDSFLNSPTELWIQMLTMIDLLTPLIIQDTPALDLPKDLRIAGLALVDIQGNGKAILTKDIFSAQPLFSDQTYFQEHPPVSEDLPIANGTLLVSSPPEHPDEIYLTNTMLIDKTIYTSLGAPLSDVAKGLAMGSNSEVIIKSSDGDWIGFTSSGYRLTDDQLRNLKGLVQSYEENPNAVNDSQNPYFVTPLKAVIPDLELYLFVPKEREQKILQTILKLNKDLTTRFSMQLLLLTIIAMIAAFLLIGRLALSVTRPIIQLADATKEVSEGKYTSVVLPEMGSRKDEIATLSHAFGSMIEGLQEREKIRGVLNKIVSKDVADEILKSSIHLGGEDRIVTMLFSDIRDFTKLTENLSPQNTISLLNTYMTKMSRLIEGEGGIIDKYVGDEIMALYGAPTQHPDHAIRALSAAVLMRESLKKWNQDRIAQGETPLQMGIGIHTGLVVCGNMGAEDRLNYTVVGSNVNLAARLCQVAKPMQIIISEHTAKEPKVRDSFTLAPLPPISLKGFSEPIPAYEVLKFKWEGEG